MELKFYSIELLRNGKSTIHTYRKYAAKSISCARYTKRWNFFHVGRNNPYIQKCDKLCNERMDAEGFKS
jgi:hypothetical protein